MTILDEFDAKIDRLPEDSEKVGFWPRKDFAEFKKQHSTPCVLEIGGIKFDGVLYRDVKVFGDPNCPPDTTYCVAFPDGMNAFLGTGDDLRHDVEYGIDWEPVSSDPVCSFFDCPDMATSQAPDVSFPNGKLKVCTRHWRALGGRD